MWVTPDGVQHTLALPEPVDVLSARGLETFAVLVAAADRDDLELWIDDRLIALHDASFEPDPEGLFFERVPAAGLLDGDLSTLDGLAAALDAVDPRWQVDLLLALHDVLDGIERP